MLRIFAPKKIWNWLLSPVTYDKMHDEELALLNVKIKTTRLRILQILPELREIARTKVNLFVKYEWKRVLRNFLIFAFLISLIGYSVYKYYEYKVEYKYVTVPIKDTIYVPDSAKNLNKFLYDIGYDESRNNYFAENKITGAVGYWQFLPSTLKYMGINVSIEKYKNSPELQRAVMIMYLKDCKQQLAIEIAKYNGTYHNGVLITESGLLAASHLGNPEAVKSFLKSNGAINAADTNGVSISSRIRKFSGYYIKLE